MLSTITKVLKHNNVPYWCRIVACFSKNVAVMASFEEKEDAATDNNVEDHPYKNIFPWKSKMELVNCLMENIVHKDDGLVVINKPFGVGVKPKDKSGIAVQEMTHVRGIGTTNYTLHGVVPQLREALNKSELILVKSAERMSSGLAVFADNMQHAEKFGKILKLSRMLSFDTPLYKYLVITAGVPFTNQTHFREKVAVHLKSSPISDLMQPEIERKFSKNSIKTGDLRTVHVQVNVLKYGDHKTGLLEIQTSSVRYNFLRVYCADLLIPMLGDHLYSCRVQSILGVPTKIDISHVSPGSADQKLSTSVLDALAVKSSIEIPPHMHLQSYSLHNYNGKGKHLVLSAPPPKFFDWTAKRLNLS